MRKNNFTKAQEGHVNKSRYLDAPQIDSKPQKPVGLDYYGRQLWDRLVPQLVAIGAATQLDEQALLSLCNWWSIYRRATKELRTADLADCANLLKTATSAYDRFNKLGEQFGLTPKSRQALELKPQQQDELTKFMAA